MCFSPLLDHFRIDLDNKEINTRDFETPRTLRLIKMRARQTDPRFDDVASRFLYWISLSIMSHFHPLSFRRAPCWRSACIFLLVDPHCIMIRRSCHWRRWHLSWMICCIKVVLRILRPHWIHRTTPPVATRPVNIIVEDLLLFNLRMQWHRRYRTMM